MNNKHLPIDIFSKIGITFSNPINRILTNQYPYKVKTKTVYLTKKTKFRNIFEKTLEPTVIIFRSKDGEYLNSIYIPKAKNNDPYCRIIAREENIDNRIPQSYLKD